MREQYQSTATTQITPISQIESRTDSVAQLEDRIQVLEGEIQAHMVKERTLMQEMKRKTENARQMIEAKDKQMSDLKTEIAQLSSQLKNNNTNDHDNNNNNNNNDDSVLEFEKPWPDSSPVTSPPSKTVRVTRSVSSNNDTLRVEDILQAEEKKVMTEFLRQQDEQQHVNHQTSGKTASTSPSSSSSSSRFIVFKEEFFRRAIYRENDLLDKLKLLKTEINHLRGRLSIIPPTQTTGPVLQSTSASTPATSSSPRNDISLQSSSLATEKDIQEREQRLIYLKQAFTSFLKAKNAIEMENLGRVICAILGVTIEEENSIMENILKLTPAVVATSTFDSFSQSFASIFS